MRPRGQMLAVLFIPVDFALERVTHSVLKVPDASRASKGARPIFSDQHAP